MKRFKGHFVINDRKALLVALIFVLQACGPAADLGTNTTDGKARVRVNRGMAWLNEEVKHAQGNVNQANLKVAGAYVKTDAATKITHQAAYCFDNGSSVCQRASRTILDRVQDAPVAINRLELNLRKDGGAAVLEAAFVQTGKLEFDQATGEAVISESAMRRVAGNKPCEIGQNAVGWKYESGSKRIITGIGLAAELLDEPNLDKAYVPAGRVTHRALIGLFRGNNLFEFDYFPSMGVKAELAYFGNNSEASFITQSNANHWYLDFGPPDEAPNPELHVLLGYCIRGTQKIKTGEVDASGNNKFRTVPLVLSASTTVAEPRIVGNGE